MVFCHHRLLSSNQCNALWLQAIVGRIRCREQWWWWWWWWWERCQWWSRIKQYQSRSNHHQQRCRSNVCDEYFFFFFNNNNNTTTKVYFTKHTFFKERVVCVSSTWSLFRWLLPGNEFFSGFIADWVYKCIHHHRNHRNHRHHHRHHHDDRVRRIVYIFRHHAPSLQISRQSVVPARITAYQSNDGCPCTFGRKTFTSIESTFSTRTSRAWFVFRQLVYDFVFQLHDVGVHGSVADHNPVFYVWLESHTSHGTGDFGFVARESIGPKFWKHMHGFEKTYHQATIAPLFVHRSTI